MKKSRRLKIKTREREGETGGKRNVKEKERQETKARQ